MGYILLPSLNASTYTDIDPNGKVAITYSDTFSPDPQYATLPVGQVAGGGSLRLKVLIPPGTTQASIYMQGGPWSGSSFGVTDAELDYGVDPNILSALADGANPTLFYSTMPLEKACYKYFILATRSGVMFRSMAFNFTIGNPAKYRAWRSARPWTGGPATNSVDGLDQGLPALGQAPCTASVFSGGISVKNGAFQRVVTQQLADPVNISGAIKVDPGHVGQIVDIIAYVKTASSGGISLTVGESNALRPWDQNPATLLPFMKNVRLQANHPLNLFTGNFPNADTLNIFFGYRLQNGTMVHNPQSIDVTVR